MSQSASTPDCGAQQQHHSTKQSFSQLKLQEIKQKVRPDMRSKIYVYELLPFSSSSSRVSVSTLTRVKKTERKGPLERNKVIKNVCLL